MLDDFRDELEHLLFRYAKKGVKLLEVGYSISKDENDEVYDLPNLKIILEVGDA